MFEKETHISSDFDHHDFGFSSAVTVIQSYHVWEGFTDYSSDFDRIMLFCGVIVMLRVQCFCNKVFDSLLTVRSDV